MIKSNVQNRDKKECVPGDRHRNFPKTEGHRQIYC